MQRVAARGQIEREASIAQRDRSRGLGSGRVERNEGDAIGPRDRVARIVHALDGACRPDQQMTDDVALAAGLRGPHTHGRRDGSRPATSDGHAEDPAPAHHTPFGATPTRNTGPEPTSRTLADALQPSPVTAVAPVTRKRTT